MPRQRRFMIAGMPQHVIQRGHNRQACFFADKDRWRYLDILSEAAERNEVSVHSYVLMSNHVHLLVTPRQPYGIAHMIQDLGRKFVRYINRRYERTGGLWEGRYKSCLVDSDAYLLTCMRYIEMNPVRAGMVTRPGEYQWSSYAVNALGKPDALISPHPVYQGLGRSSEQRRRSYRSMFDNGMDEFELDNIREALNRELVLGQDGFKSAVESQLGRAVRPGKRGRPRRKVSI